MELSVWGLLGSTVLQILALFPFHFYPKQGMSKLRATGESILEWKRSDCSSALDGDMKGMWGGKALILDKVKTWNCLLSIKYQIRRYTDTQCSIKIAPNSNQVYIYVLCSVKAPESFTYELKISFGKWHVVLCEIFSHEKIWGQ